MKRFLLGRKGIFDGDLDEDAAKDAIKSGVVDTMIKTKSIDERIQSLQRANDDILVTSQVLGVRPEQTKIYRDYVASNPFLAKAGMYSTGSSVGDQWVPTGYSPQLYDLIKLALKCAALHDSIDMPTNPFIFPVVSSDATGYLTSERTGADDTLTSGYRVVASDVGTTNFTLTAVKLAGRVVFSEELTEDSIVPILPIIRSNIVTAMSTAIENAIINGDTGGTHMDSDTTNSTDARKAWLGYRISAQAAAKVAMDSTNFNGEKLIEIRKDMGKYGIDPTQLTIVTGIVGYSKLLTLKDANNVMLVTTLDKYGPIFTVLTGELGKVFGMPIVISEKIREDLNATGTYDHNDYKNYSIGCL